VVDLLLDPFRAGIGQRALLEMLIVALACGPLGVWVLLYRQAYAAESMSHGMLPGLVVAAVAGAPLVLGAAGGVLLAAAGIALAARDERVGSDVAVAVAITALFGLGATLALSPAAPPRLGELLFGDLLGVRAIDLATTGALAAGVGVALAAAHRPLAVAIFDPSSARALGARPGATTLLLLVLLGVTTVAAVQALGNLLVVALVIAPAATALNLVARLTAALALAAGLTAVAGLAGLYVSYYLDVAAGASVALCAIALFALSLARAPHRGPRRTGARSPIDALGA
jgi:ABC-type Mn2+/Zn2+ transport system permease subunit